MQATMFQIHYGVGYMRIPIGCVGTLFMGKGGLFGHSCSTGLFAFLSFKAFIFYWTCKSSSKSCIHPDGDAACYVCKIIKISIRKTG